MSQSKSNYIHNPYNCGVAVIVNKLTSILDTDKPENNHKIQEDTDTK